MFKQISIKNHHSEIQLLTKRCMFAMVTLCLLTGILIWRLAYLQIYKNELYTTLSTNNAIDLVPVEPTRGLIYDRNGILLADNIPVFSLDIIPLQVSDLKKTLAALNKIIELSDNDISQFRKQLRQHRRFDEIPLKLRLSEQEVAKFTENQHRFPGVLIKARLMRNYTYGESFSHVLGYVGRINVQELGKIDTINYSASHYIGKLGIEKYYEEALHGKVGYQEVENDASGKPIRVLKEINGSPGKNIYLTLDSGLQFATEKALANHNGAVVIIQPKTGQILAMVSEPAYDPNIFVTGISHKDYSALQQAEAKPLYDRALRGLYPMASTIKPYLALQALQLNIVDPNDVVFDKGVFQLPNSSHPFHCWRRYGHGKVNLSKAITSSCDIYFYGLATKMGIQNIHDVLTQFGFGSHTQIDLDGELAGNVPSPQWKMKAKGLPWYPGDTIITSIGQGDAQATPLQMALAISTLATRGKRFTPFLLLGEQLPGDHYVANGSISFQPIILQDEKYWEIVINAMHEVVSSYQGTAYAAFGRNYTYTIAGKTGTGALSRRRNPDELDKQQNMPEKLRDHHIFVAFAPVDNPQIAIAVVTEHSNYAIETTRAIFDYYFTRGGQQRVVKQSEI